jgi:hypothetical protein
MRPAYCYDGPTEGAIGNYLPTGTYEYSYPVYSNGTYYLKLKSIDGIVRWVIDVIVGSVPDGYTDKELMQVIGEMAIGIDFEVGANGEAPILPTENSWEFGTLTEGYCPSSSSSYGYSTSSSSSSSSSGLDINDVTDYGIGVVDYGIQVINT